LIRRSASYLESKAPRLAKPVKGAYKVVKFLSDKSDGLFFKAVKSFYKGAVKYTRRIRTRLTPAKSAIAATSDARVVAKTAGLFSRARLFGIVRGLMKGMKVAGWLGFFLSIADIGYILYRLARGKRDYEAGRKSTEHALYYRYYQEHRLRFLALNILPSVLSAVVGPALMLLVAATGVGAVALGVVAVAAAVITAAVSIGLSIYNTRLEKERMEQLKREDAANAAGSPKPATAPVRVPHPIASPPAKRPARPARPAAQKHPVTARSVLSKKPHREPTYADERGADTNGGASTDASRRESSRNAGLPPDSGETVVPIDRDRGDVVRIHPQGVTPRNGFDATVVRDGKLIHVYPAASMPALDPEKQPGAAAQGTLNEIPPSTGSTPPSISEPADARQRRNTSGTPAPKSGAETRGPRTSETVSSHNRPDTHFNDAKHNLAAQ
jgi:hypothetical protein